MQSPTETPGASPRETGEARPAPRRQRFDDLPVWKSAAELAHLVLTVPSVAGGPGWPESLLTALQDRTLETTQHLVDAFERPNVADAIVALAKARSCLSQSRSHLLIAQRLSEGETRMAAQSTRLTDALEEAQRCEDLLRQWSDTLQTASVPDPRFLMAQRRTGGGMRG